MAALIWLGVGALLVWAFAWLVFQVSSAAIHLLLVVSAIAVIAWLVRRVVPGRTTAA